MINKKKDTMDTYRIEVKALKLIDVEASSKEDAIKKAKERGLNCETTRTENWSKDISANYHYEDYDFNNAEVSKS
jgi:glycerol-3-phosphate cytidylyltransferase-like family protein